MKATPSENIVRCRGLVVGRAYLNSIRSQTFRKAGNLQDPHRACVLSPNDHGNSARGLRDDRFGYLLPLLRSQRCKFAASPARKQNSVARSITRI